MREPKYYTRSLLWCQGLVTGTYMTIGIIVYYFCGSYVASPALGSAGVTMKKVCYGFALPGLTVTALLVTHVSIQPHILECSPADLSDPRKAHLCPHPPPL